MEAAASLAGCARISDDALERAASELCRLAAALRGFAPTAGTRSRVRSVHDVLARAALRDAGDTDAYAQALELVRDCGAADVASVYGLARDVPAVWAYAGNLAAAVDALLTRANLYHVTGESRLALATLERARGVRRHHLPDSAETALQEHKIALLRHRCHLALEDLAAAAAERAQLIELATSIAQPAVWRETWVEIAGELTERRDGSGAEEALGHVLHSPSKPDPTAYAAMPPLGRLGMFRAQIGLMRLLGRPRQAGVLQRTCRGLATEIGSARHLRLWGYADATRTPTSARWLPFFDYLGN